MKINHVEIAERIRAGVASWNDSGDLSAFLNRFRDDAVLSSPTATDRNGEQAEWLLGRHEIGLHLDKFRATHPKLRVTKVFIGRQLYSVLLEDGENFLVHIEPDQGDGRIRRMIICRSVDDLSWQDKEVAADEPR